MWCYGVHKSVQLGWLFGFEFRRVLVSACLRRCTRYQDILYNERCMKTGREVKRYRHELFKGVSVALTS